VAISNALQLEAAPATPALCHFTNYLVHKRQVWERIAAELNKDDRT